MATFQKILSSGALPLPPNLSERQAVGGVGETHEHAIASGAPIAPNGPFPNNKKVQEPPCSGAPRPDEESRTYFCRTPLRVKDPEACEEVNTTFTNSTLIVESVLLITLSVPLEAFQSTSVPEALSL